MLQRVDVGARSYDRFHGVAPEETLAAVREAAEALRGARVLHVNATPYGGGVSELLRSVVPLLNDLGLVVDWRTISGDDDFFNVTKRIHNALQGAPNGLDAAARDTYLRNAGRNASQFEENYDFVFVHDPQPLPLPSLRGKGTARWIWRCHIDTAAPNRDVWTFLRPFLEPFDAAVFTMDAFVPPDLPLANVKIIPPAIDPLSPKNLDLPDSLTRQLLSWIGLRLDRPLLTQVARFDPWKDPLGVIAAYRLAREHVPNLQLALVGSMALDDPEGWEIYRQLATEAESDPLINVFTNLTGVGNIEVNAFQRLSDVVVQKSIREGFGLVVSEALWKGTPVVGGRAGGIPLQLADGVGGYLIDSVEGTAEAIVRLLKNPDEAENLARRGRERVRKQFLLPRLLLDQLLLMSELAGAGLEAGPPEPYRDPVCGMTVTATAEVVSSEHAGATYRFCSQACRQLFAEDPEHYLRRYFRPLH